MLAATSFLRKCTLHQHLVDFRPFSKGPSKIGERLSDFFSVSLVFEEFFGRPIWGKPSMGVKPASDPHYARGVFCIDFS